MNLDLDHAEVGTMWYGINDRMANKILSTSESEWLITLALDIDQFYDYNGFVGLWMHT
jgi:hypothetical protein